VGAPSNLVEAAHLAALDEIRHSRSAFGLARFFGEDGAAPSALPLPPAVEVSSSLSLVALRTFQEGCLSETAAVARARAVLAPGVGPDQVRKHLEVVVADEARHAALAWRTVAWALSRGDANGDASVRARLQTERTRLRSDDNHTSITKEDGLDQQVLILVTLPWLDSLLTVARPMVEEWFSSAPAQKEGIDHADVDAAVHETARLISANLKQSPGATQLPVV